MSTTEPTQKHRFAAIETALGEDRFLLKYFSGKEELGRLFDYSITLLDPMDDVDADELIGQNITIRLQVETDEHEHVRYFNGFVSSLSFVGYHNNAGIYHARMVPWLWLLSRTSDCQSFQEETVPQILEQIFMQFGFKDYRFDLRGQYLPKVFCVQYNETALNFVSRLMENEGIYYWWEHHNGRHVMVITDDMTTHVPHPLRDKIEWKERTGVPEDGYLYNWRVQKTVSSGGFALNDYNFKMPKEDLRSTKAQEKKHAASKFEHFEYPGLYRDLAYGEALSNIRLEEAQAGHELAEATVTARAIATGYKFDLVRAERDDQERRYLVVSSMVSIAMDGYSSGSGGGGDKYDCQITAIPEGAVYRPARLTPKPVVTGPQPALVVGPPGEEIYCDQFGRVKVHFYWDRRSLANEKSSKWVRVSQPSAGGSWGFTSIPRIGQEVLVEYMNGDPDQPIITGRVYNEENRFPYDPPSFKERSGWKTNSSPGGGGFNELRFEDKKGAEQIFMHGQKDMDVRVLEKQREWIGISKHLIVQGDSHELIARDKHEYAGRHHTEEVKEHRFSKIGKDALSEVGKDFQLKAGAEVRLEAGGDMYVAGQGAISVQAGSKVVIEAPSITLKGAGGFIKVDSSGVTIVGNVVLINSGGSPDSLTKLPKKALDRPRQPEEADDSVAGKVESTEGMGHALTAATWEQQEVSDLAARDAKPFEELEPGAGDAPPEENAEPGPLSDLLSDALGAVKRMGEEVKGYANQISEGIASTAAAVKNEITSARQRLQAELAPLYDAANQVKAAVEEVQGAIKEVEAAVKEAKEVANDVVDEVKGVVTEAVAVVKEVTDAVKQTAETVKEVAETVKTAVEDAKDAAQEVVDAVTDAVKQTVAPVKEAAKAVRELGDSVEEVTDSMKEAAKEVEDNAKEALDTQREAVRSMEKEARDKAREATDAVRGTFAGMEDAAREIRDSFKISF
jgi:type VI secretion system secreted protein VgrG